MLQHPAVGNRNPMTRPDHSRNPGRVAPEAHTESDCAEVREQDELSVTQHSTEEHTVTDSKTEISRSATSDRLPPPEPDSTLLNSTDHFIPEFALFPGDDILEPLQSMIETAIAIENSDAVASATEVVHIQYDELATLRLVDAADSQTLSDPEPEPPTTFDDAADQSDIPTEQPSDNVQIPDEEFAPETRTTDEAGPGDSHGAQSDTADEDEDWTAEQPDEHLLFVSTRCRNCRAYYRFRIAEKLQFACRECGELCVVKPSIAGRLKQWFGDRLRSRRRG